MDAQIDYSKYSLEDLYSAAENVDREAYPERAKEIDDLIAQREKESPEEINDEKAAGNKATRVDRLLGAIVDAIVMTLASIPLYMHFGLEAFEDPSLSLVLTGFLYGVVVALVLQGYLMHTRGQTIGKYLINMRIENLDGTQASFTTIFFMRMLPMSACANIPMVGAFIAGLINPLVIFGKERRCLHDYIASTKVCYVDDEQYEQK